MWERRIAAAQTRFPGFQGYRFEPPIAGVQEDWLSILRFDNEDHLQAWLESPVQACKLVEESGSVHRGFSYPRGADRLRSMVHASRRRRGVRRTAGVETEHDRSVDALPRGLPVRTLWVQTPWLMKAAGLPFWLALFIANVASVLLLNVLVPRVSGLFGWWLNPSLRAHRTQTNAARRGADHRLLRPLHAGIFWRLS